MEMKLDETINKILSLLKSGLSSKLDIVQSDCVSLVDGNIMCANEDLIVIAFGIEEEEPNLFAFNNDIEGSIKGKPLFDYLFRHKGKKIKIIHDEKKDELVFTGKGKAGFKLEELDSGKASLFDQIDEVVTDEETEWFEFDSEEFVRALSIVYSCASDDPNMNILNNIYYEDGLFEACDQFRYATIQSEIEIEDALLIPKNAAYTIMDMKPDSYCKSNFWIIFYSSELEVGVAFKNIDEQWPDFEDVKKNVKKGAKKGMKVEFPSSMEELLKESFIFSKRDSEESDLVEIVLGKELVISSKNEHGWFSRSVKNDNPPKVEIKFNIDPNMMIQYLAISKEAVLSGERVVMMGEDFMYFVNLER